MRSSKSLVLMAILVTIVLLPEAGRARVFKFNSENIGTYFKGDYTQSTLGTNAYALSSGNSTQFVASGVDYHMGFELGLLYTYRRFTLRLGIESVRSKPLSNVSGVDAGATELMTINSAVSTFAPVVHLDLNLYQGDTTRLYLALGAGQVSMTSVNDYTFTASGLAAFPGVADYQEKVQAQFISGITSLGFEFLFTDTTTMAIELGYRTMNGLSFTHQNAISQNLDGSAIAIGDAATNSDASPRTLNMTGAFVGIAYRFYVDII